MQTKTNADKQYTNRVFAKCQIWKNQSIVNGVSTKENILFTK